MTYSGFEAELKHVALTVVNYDSGEVVDVAGVCDCCGGCYWCGDLQPFAS
jgi:hypothetical protein